MDQCAVVEPLPKVAARTVVVVDSVRLNGVVDMDDVVRVFCGVEGARFFVKDVVRGRGERFDVRRGIVNGTKGFKARHLHRVAG